MSEAEHWRAEDYEWDPSTLRATRRQDRTLSGTRSGDKPAAEAGRPDPAESDASPAERDASPEEPTQAEASEAAGEETTTEGGSGAEPPAGEVTAGAAEVEQETVAAAEGSGGDAPRESVPIVRDILTVSQGPSKKKIPMRCQVDGCSKDLSKEKDYYQRYRICEEHLKLSSLIKDGIEQRFCQQCGRFHVLADFDADKRSCRARLNLHNDRRRKRVPDANTPRQDLANPQPRGRRTRTRRKRMPFGEQAEEEDLEALDGTPSPVKGGKRYELRGERRSSEDPAASSALDLEREALHPSFVGFTNAYRGFPLEVNAALQGLQSMQSMLAPSSNAIPGAVLDDRFLGSPNPSVTHFSQPHELHGELRGDSELPDLTWLRQSSIEAQEQGSARSTGAGYFSHHPSLYKSASEPVYGLGRHVGKPAAGWGQGSEDPEKTRSDGTTPSAKHFAPVPASDAWYSQHEQLLRNYSWREEAQRQQLRQAAAELDYAPPFSISGNVVRRPGSETVHMVHDSLLPNHLSAERSGGAGALASVASDSSSSHFTPHMPQESAGPRHSASGRLPGARRRLMPGSPPLPPRESNSMRASGDKPTARLQPRHSDPGSWLQHSPSYARAAAAAEGSDPGSMLRFHQGFLVDSSPHTTPTGPEAALRMSRSGMKLSVPPEGVPLSMRADYLRMLNTTDAAYFDAAMRPGCTHIVATSISQAAVGSGQEAAARLLAGGKEWAGMDVTIQVPGAVVKLAAGRQVARWTGAELAALQPPAPQPAAFVACPGASLAVRLQPHSRPQRLLARSQGAFLADCQVDGPDVDLQIPAAAGDGLLWLEAEADGILSDAVPLVLTRDADVAAELAGLADSGLSVSLLEALTIAFGLAVQCADWLGASPSTPPAPGAALPPGCCSVLSLERQADGEHCMSNPRLLRLVSHSARRLAGLCCQEGWPALAAKMLPVAAVGLSTWPQLVAAMEDVLGRQRLMFAAVASGSLSMVILLLDLFRQAGEEVDLVAVVEGATALHLAAANPPIAAVLLERCPAARRLWNCTRDGQGRAPADIAYMASGRGGSLADCGPAGPTPETPRVGDLLPSARVSGAEGLRSTWPPSISSPGRHVRETGGAWSRFRPQLQPKTGQDAPPIPQDVPDAAPTTRVDPDEKLPRTADGGQGEAVPDGLLLKGPAPMVIDITANSSASQSPEQGPSPTPSC